MSGISNDLPTVRKRRERVLQLIHEGFRLITIAQMLEVSGRTIERDWQAGQDALKRLDSSNNPKI